MSVKMKWDLKPTLAPKRKEYDADKREAVIILGTAVSSDRFYEHDCERCRYLGWYQEPDTIDSDRFLILDLYFCRSVGYCALKNRATVIARYSSECSDYKSGMVSATELGEKALYEAVRRAIAFEFMTLAEWAKWTAFQRREN